MVKAAVNFKKDGKYIASVLFVHRDINTMHNARMIHYIDSLLDRIGDTDNMSDSKIMEEIILNVEKNQNPFNDLTSRDDGSRGGLAYEDAEYAAILFPDNRFNQENLSARWGLVSIVPEHIRDNMREAEYNFNIDLNEKELDIQEAEGTDNKGTDSPDDEY